jgi:integrase
MNALLPLGEPVYGALITPRPLAEATDAFALNSKSPATQRAYRADMRAFAFWCRQHGLEPLPASPETVARHLAQLAIDGLAVASIGRRLAAIRYAHKLAELESPTGHERVRTVLSGIRRTIGTAPVRKAPVTAERLGELYKHLSPGLIGIRDRALLALGFAGAFRRSELVALQVGDLIEVSDGLRVLIRRSKTDKTGEGHEIAIPRGYRIRPVEAVQAWLEAAQITEGPVFRRVRLGGKVGVVPLSGHAVAEIIKKMAARAGLDPVDFSGHSLRAGFVTSAVETNAPIMKIAEQTRHKSLDMLRVYSRRVDLFREHAGAGFL